ncbi:MULTISPECIES: hypothetical protein [unclassified Streptomyces]|uniref:hypothetical protein n=1 Tax=unclassified Streptomyces TaxID=2593676 RepID=UPI0036EA4C1C
MTDQDVTVRRARAEDIPGLAASSTRLFAEDGGTRDATINVDWPREHGTASFAAALEDPERLMLTGVAYLTSRLAVAPVTEPIRCPTTRP